MSFNLETRPQSTREEFKARGTFPSVGEAVRAGEALERGLDRALDIRVSVVQVVYRDFGSRPYPQEA
jgi:hypothetical protein